MCRAACSAPNLRPQCGHGVRSSSIGSVDRGGGNSLIGRPSFWNFLTTWASFIAARNASDFCRHADFGASTSLEMPTIPFLACRAASFRTSTSSGASGSLWSTTLKTFLFCWKTFTQIFTCFACASALNFRPQCGHGRSWASSASASAIAFSTNCMGAGATAFAAWIGGESDRTAAGGGPTGSDALAPRLPPPPPALRVPRGWGGGGCTGSSEQCCGAFGEAARGDGALLATSEDFREVDVCLGCASRPAVGAAGGVPKGPRGAAGGLWARGGGVHASASAANAAAAAAVSARRPRLSLRPPRGGRPPAAPTPALASAAAAGAASTGLRLRLPLWRPVMAARPVSSALSPRQAASGGRLGSAANAPDPDRCSGGKE
mmetsp:Transcript_35751/g.76231  ORF Transcript_35751/g.76231 Transcript_35751/m.76231 type:complete len:376 (-) Transcript_35751:134-1261(-)